MKCKMCPNDIPRREWGYPKTCGPVCLSKLRSINSKKLNDKNPNTRPGKVWNNLKFDVFRDLEAEHERDDIEREIRIQGE